jgi:methyl-accepting chemotaxis protein
MSNIFSFETLSLMKRLAFLVIVPLILTLLFGLFTIKLINDSRNTLNEITTRSEMLMLAHNLLDSIEHKVVATIHDANNSRISLLKAYKILKENKILIDEQLATFSEINKADIIRGDAGAVAAKKAVPAFVSAMNTAINLTKLSDKEGLKTFVSNTMNTKIMPLINATTIHQREDLESTSLEIQAALDETTLNENIVILVLLANIIILALLGYVVFRSIAKQTKVLTSTVEKLNKGNKKARAVIKGKHELAQLGTALNELLDEQERTEQQIVEENDKLNDSVFDLLESVTELSERNLTVRAIVTEDATGSLADAINQLAIDTGDVLIRVRDIAVSVEATSQTVDKHTNEVKQLAESEQEEALKTSVAITTLINHLDEIVNSSTSANYMANETTEATEKAHKAVGKTRESMTEIRETVQETGKRIKRLGERSQEITHIVDLINTITERTTVLAINASMQALSAGEAGKGFSVIAEEIQRLAESSRESTDQIAHLIKNIQQETRTTMITMDHTIEQVVTGSALAEDASDHMQLTLDATNNLTRSVESIANASKQQLDISKSLQIRSEEILKATQSTGEEMDSLGTLTKNMAENARNLVDSVKVFRLEDTKSSAV